MNIYSPIKITEEIERKFKPVRLAVKELNGVKYFCKTIRKNIEKYTGSGTRWSNHIKKYGKENIKTIWVSDWFYCPHHLQDFALMFSEYNKITESNEWANLIPENGLTGMVGSKKGHMYGIAKPKSESHRKSISNTLTGITLVKRHGKEKANRIKRAMSLSKKGKKMSIVSRERHSNESNPNAKRVKINGIVFGTVKHASETLKLSKTTIISYLKNKKKLNDRIWEALYINDVA